MLYTHMQCINIRQQGPDKARMSKKPAASLCALHHTEQLLVPLNIHCVFSCHSGLVPAGSNTALALKTPASSYPAIKRSARHIYNGQ